MSVVSQAAPLLASYDITPPPEADSDEADSDEVESTQASQLDAVSAGCILLSYGLVEVSFDEPMMTCYIV